VGDLVGVEPLEAGDGVAEAAQGLVRHATAEGGEAVAVALLEEGVLAEALGKGGDDVRGVGEVGLGKGGDAGVGVEAHGHGGAVEPGVGELGVDVGRGVDHYQVGGNRVA